MARPGVLVFAALLVGPLVWALVKKLRGAVGRVDDGHRNELEVEEPEGDELEGSMAGTGWSFAVARGRRRALRGAAVGEWLVLRGGTADAPPGLALRPRRRGCPALAGTARMAWATRSRRPGRRRGRRPGRAPPWWSTSCRDRADARLEARQRDLAVAGRTFAAMGVFLVLVGLFGYLAATLVFVPVGLLYAARTTPRTAVVYTLVLGLVLLSLPSLLPVELPMGLLQ